MISFDVNAPQYDLYFFLQNHIHWILTRFDRSPVNVRVFLTRQRLPDGVWAVPEGSGWLHPAERAGMEREGSPPAALHCRFTLPSVPDRTHHPPGEVKHTEQADWFWAAVTKVMS